MKLSKIGADKLIAREGKRNIAYQDTKGIWTIGVGHTGPEVKRRLWWSDERVAIEFAKDVVWAEDAVNSVSVDLEQHEFDALVSFVFNIGATAWNKSTIKKLLNAGDKVGAANQFMRWRFPPEIKGRRKTEEIQFKTPYQ